MNTFDLEVEKMTELLTYERFENATDPRVFR